MRFRMLIPQTPCELREHYHAIQFLSGFLPEWPPGAWQNLMASVPTIVLVYSDPIHAALPEPLAMGQYHVFSTSPQCCDIHGVIRQDLRGYLPRHNYFSRQIGQAFLSFLFFQLHMDAVRVTRSPRNHMITGFIRQYPFQHQKQGRPDTALSEQETLYLLTKTDFELSLRHELKGI